MSSSGIGTGRLKEKFQDQEDQNTCEESIGKFCFDLDFVLEKQDYGVHENHGFKNECVLAIVVYDLCPHYHGWLYHQLCVGWDHVTIKLNQVISISPDFHETPEVFWWFQGDGS